ncbi:MAG: hypothetical protein ACK55Z_21025, partial [bacterium]
RAHTHTHFALNTYALNNHSLNTLPFSCWGSRTRLQLGTPNASQTGVHAVRNTKRIVHYSRTMLWRMKRGRLADVS